MYDLREYVWDANMQLQATKSQTLSQRFTQSTAGKTVKTISPGVTAIVKETQSQDQNACCTPTFCIPIFADILQLCLSGGFCIPNFEVGCCSGPPTIAIWCVAELLHCGTRCVYACCQDMQKASK